MTTKSESSSGPVTAATPAPERDSTGTPDGRTYSGPADAAAPGQAAYEAYVMAAPGDLNFREPDKLDDWEYPAWEAAAQAGHEALAAREPHAADGLTYAPAYDQLYAALARLACEDWLGTQGYDGDELQRRVEFASDKLAALPQPAPGPAKPDLGTAWRLLNETREQLATLRALHAVTAGFATEWAGLFTTLPDDYRCEMTCAEANAAADLYRALGDDDTAQAIITAHAEHDDDEERASHVEDQ